MVLLFTFCLSLYLMWVLTMTLKLYNIVYVGITLQRVGITLAKFLLVIFFAFVASLIYFIYKYTFRAMISPYFNGK